MRPHTQFVRCLSKRVTLQTAQAVKSVIFFMPMDLTEFLKRPARLIQITVVDVRLGLCASALRDGS